MMKVWVLRLGHRVERDKRVTMHVFLTARAFGASGVVYCGQRDVELERRIEGVVGRWGGVFEVRFEGDWRGVVEGWRGVVCHLTMYGVNVDNCLSEVAGDGDVLVVVGSQKVPRGVFECVDFNVAVGGQPHSEVAALAVFLDRLFEGKELKRKFEGAKLEVVPKERGKEVKG